MEKLGNRPFMLHHAQVFDQFAVVNAYVTEEAKFLQNVKRIPRSSLPKNANVVSSHTVYRIKMEDDDSLLLKARIAPHGNEDSDTDNLKSDCCMYPPLGIRIILSIAIIKKWRVLKIDVKSAFLQSRPAERDVYVNPPRESKRRNEVWLLLTAAYGLINANAKWQKISDTVFSEFGLISLNIFP